MNLRRTLIALVSIGFSTMWGVALYTYAVLPARIPMHFDAEGAPDRIMEKTPLGWLALPIVFTVMTALFVAMAIFVPKLAARSPRFINVPDKQAFLELPEAARVKALDPMRDLSLMMPIALHALCIYIQWGSAEIALRHRTVLSPFPVVLVLVYSFATLGYTVVRMRDAVKEAASHR